MLKPAFRANGTITAATSSANADGAAALVLTTRSIAEREACPSSPTIRAMPPTARSRNGSPPRRSRPSASCWTGPAGVGDVDLFEINEAFAVVAMAAPKELGLPSEKLNVNGGACALGHPIGATGARLIVTLLHALEAPGPETRRRRVVHRRRRGDRHRDRACRPRIARPIRQESARRAARTASLAASVSDLTKERKMKFYLCKYIPPRTDFLATMTAEERNWMKQHGDFSE